MSTLNQNQNLTLKQNIQSFWIVGLVIALAALAGILGRPLAFLAMFWPANAILLGLFLRFKSLNNPGGWLGAFVAFIIADLMTGNYFLLTLCLTIANLSHPFASLTLIRLFKLNFREYNQGLTFFYLFLISAFGGCLASALFAIFTVPYMPNTFMAMDRLWTDFGMWWTGEILNVITFLPIVLALPSLKEFKQLVAEKRQQGFEIQNILPMLFIIASVVLVHFFIGPGAIMFPIAALIWAALTYNLFLVTLINCFVCMFLYNSISGYYLTESPDAYISTAISIRIGLFMLALGPLTLSIISLNRHKLYHQILYLANHDELTTAMNRRFFYEEGEKTLSAQTTEAEAETVSILVLDLDYFKKINDTYGHAVGDKVLKEFTAQVKSQIRSHDLFGRIGGEEFAILLKNLSLKQSVEIAQRICNKVDSTPILLDDGQELYISVSIGLSYQSLPYCTQIQQLINRADHALYQAKEKGRNQLCLEPDLQAS
ncbi:GGDEF domain-containing protein [Acinetobacter shaoyimingii]|uniref:diguanylate cyclase n=1 Tax=Acinetobacter shaoyimingii TaxID=2715164 RepID=A0A6G8RW66_9GAMM|nr:GGDEF domain-containing protein [Acinetobacter shaoyimingii]QIO05963.1 diguanylate cyclase [Acinetobacter shaoyimingii]